MQPLLSFIIPAYNSHKYITDCLDSIYQSVTYPQDAFEVIVVDDCSTDDTRELVRNYASKVTNLRLLCQPKNHCQGAARNWGIKEAKGRYVTFVDSDDAVLEGIVEAMNIADRYNVDVVIGEIVHDQGINRQCLSIEKGCVKSGQEVLRQVNDRKIMDVVWAYLFRRQYLWQNDYFFAGDVQVEDHDWIADNLVHADTVMYTASPMYHYFVYPTSVCHGNAYYKFIDHALAGVRCIRVSEASLCVGIEMFANLKALGIHWIKEVYTLRKLSKCDIIRLHAFFTGPSNRWYFDELKRISRQYPFPPFQRFLMRHRRITLGICLIACPVAGIIRKSLNRIRACMARTE